MPNLDKCEFLPCNNCEYNRRDGYDNICLLENEEEKAIDEEMYDNYITDINSGKANNEKGEDTQ